MAGEDTTSRPRLRPIARTDGHLAGTAASPAPGAFALAIAGVVVTRSQLVAALRPFLPQLTDIQSFEDGERFLFVMAAEAASTGSEKA